MKRKLGGLLLALGAALGLMAFRQQATPPDLSSPQATVRSFIAAVRNQDVAAILQCVQDKADEKLLKEVVGTASIFPKCTVHSMLAETDVNTAHVAVEYSLESARPEDHERPDARLVDMFLLVKQGDVWRLKPTPNVKEVAGDPKKDYFPFLLATRPLSLAVAIAGSNEIAKNVAAVQASDRAARCLGNVKQVALGVLMYTQDYDEITPRIGASYSDLIYPYVRNRQVFTCPLSPTGTISYTFNSNVQGVPMRAVTAPAKTVMLYEGKDGKLDYRHGRQAAVGFMDGHTKLIKPEEATGLIWTVKVTKAPAKATGKKGRK